MAASTVSNTSASAPSTSATQGNGTTATDLAGLASMYADSQKTSMAMAAMQSQNDTVKAIAASMAKSHEGLPR